jgi:hypothetical protein
VDVAFDAARDDLDVAVMAVGVPDERRDEQRDVLHEAEHGESFHEALAAPCRMQ